MSETKIWIALSIIAGLFLLTGGHTNVYAQLLNDTFGGNTTNATSLTGGNWTNATGTGNETGNISGCGDRGC